MVFGGAVCAGADGSCGGTGCWVGGDCCCESSASFGASVPARKARDLETEPEGESDAELVAETGADCARVRAPPTRSASARIHRNLLLLLDFMLPFVRRRVAQGRCLSAELWRYDD